MKLIVGLGNPGGKYKSTRHNIGFMVIEKLAKDLLPIYKSLKAWNEDKSFKAQISKIDKNLILAKPITYMNLSGESIDLIRNFYKIEIPDIWVIHDDIDLPLGKIRIRKSGASAGHRGIESMIKRFGRSDFVRFRLGIGRGRLAIHKNIDQNIPRQEIEKFVVSPFRDSEAGDAKKLLKHSVEAIRFALKEGIEKAMNRYN